MSAAKKKATTCQKCGGYREPAEEACADYARSIALMKSPKYAAMCAGPGRRDFEHGWLMGSAEVVLACAAGLCIECFKGAAAEAA